MAKTLNDQVEIPLRIRLSWGLNRILRGCVRSLPWGMGERLDTAILVQAIKRGRRLVPEQELESKYVESLSWLREQNRETPIGDYLEFGVYTGTSLTCMARAADRVSELSMRFIGFDSFQGLPREVKHESDEAWKYATFHSPRAVTEWFIKSNSVDWERVRLVEGWFDDTCNDETIRKLSIEKAGVIMIDCDLYESTRVALSFCEPLIKDYCVIVFDDWNTFELAERHGGERLAFEEFLQENPDFDAEQLDGYYEEATIFRLSRRKRTELD